ncbi:MAG: CaiB/BaiF CoA transferase family protein [Dehalococcoidia bacterium]
MKFLEGIKVIDCGTMGQGPLTGTALADLGADVIRIEPAQATDPLRANEQLWGVRLRFPTRDGGEIHLGFEPYNRGQRGMTLNLKSSGGQQLLRKLVSQSDVFIQNWSRRVASGLKLDYDSLRTAKRDIVYLESSAFGSAGPDRDAPGLDAMGVAFAGLMYLSSPHGSPPQYPAGGLGDAAAALTGVAAILGALFRKARTGEGANVEISQAGALIWLESLPILAASVTKSAMRARPRSSEANPLFNFYRCRDERWIMLGEWQPERKLKELYSELGLARLQEDERFNTFAAIRQHHTELIAELDAAFAQKNSSDWIALLRRHQILVSVVNSVTDLIDNEQARANGYIQDYPHPVYGNISTAVFPMKCDGVALTPAGAAPAWGQHTTEILAEWCGLGIDEVASLYAAGTL